MGKKYEQFGQAPGLNFDQEDTSMESKEGVQHEPITRQSIIEALRRDRDHYYSDQMPLGKLVARPDALGKHVFYVYGGINPTKTDRVLGKSGEMNLLYLTREEQVNARKLLDGIDMDKDLDEGSDIANEPSIPANHDGASSDSLDIRPGVWNGYRGTENDLKYKNGEDEGE